VGSGLARVDDALAAEVTRRASVLIDRSTAAVV